MGSYAGEGRTTGELDFTSFSNIIDGKLSSTSQTRHGINPATGKPNLAVPVSTEEDVDMAVAAGKKAFKSWRRTPYAQRQKAVLEFADALEQEKEKFAEMLVQEQGKPVRGEWTSRP
jgi:acyl-CoA reductase-like NAD-dependent aldehyde dehydrogenase